ncbi:hypothetical protein VFPFJ_10072 [Purpureocillium lilacinum]|uniref:Uncharacterized protein n=1 Tax=Purpureocillium lilacinum TaxID=33203 RepID=A0A179GKW3_PURLI|nr:hypothetical protein VFPFJ_10072 [Purpureocillium lilacinum]OAQ78040.1 hypothetical protein VFPFJ_10072 [Purpureocillium lilacinum]
MLRKEDSMWHREGPASMLTGTLSAARGSLLWLDSTALAVGESHTHLNSVRDVQTGLQTEGHKGRKGGRDGADVARKEAEARDGRVQASGMPVTTPLRASSHSCLGVKRVVEERHWVPCGEDVRMTCLGRVDTRGGRVCRQTGLVRTAE